jgi:hypothetical protein
MYVSDQTIICWDLETVPDLTAAAYQQNASPCCITTYIVRHYSKPSPA